MTTEPSLTSLHFEPPHLDEDHLALASACEPGVGLCTIVGIDGSFSRRVGAQLAVHRDGTAAGNLADDCLEQQLVRDCLAAETAGVLRYGSGSSKIDFRLPCGGGLDILVDPSPDRAACREALDALHHRRPATLALSPNTQLTARHYIPSLNIRAYGEGPELTAVSTIARAAGIAIEPIRKNSLALGQASGHPPADEWTAIVLLFHDHEWEAVLLEEAFAGRAFYIGAQGGAQARSTRVEELARRGFSDETLARIRSPIGTPHGSRTPQALALAALAEIVGEYERLRPA